MNGTFKRILAAILCAMMVLPAAVSCAEKADVDEGQSTAAVNDESAAETEPEVDPFDPGLGEWNFEGEDFTVLTKSVANYTDWGEVSIWVEQMDGDVVHDAIFERNRYLEENYNIKFNEYQSSSPSTDTQKSVAASDGAYDVVMPAFGDCGTLAASGQLLNLYNLEYNNAFEREWWDQRSISDLTIGGKLFFVSSDISNLNNDATWCTMFNKEMIENYNVPNPYELVGNNEWTYENYYNMYKSVYADLDGDGKLGPDDVYCNLTQNENYQAMYLGSGERIIDKDENDLPVIALGTNEKSVDILQICADIMNDENFSFNYHKGASKLGYHLWTTTMFEESRGLFWITNLQIVIRLRDLATPMGIVPVPKFESTQDRYYNVVWTVGSFVAVPMSNVQLERTSVILEAMAAKSRQILRPAYFDIALNGKYLRDEESIDMLEIIISDRVYDLGLAYNFGSITGVLETVISKNNAGGLMSTMAKKEAAIQKAIDKVIEKFEENT